MPMSVAVPLFLALRVIAADWARRCLLTSCGSQTGSGPKSTSACGLTRHAISAQSQREKGRWGLRSKAWHCQLTGQPLRIEGLGELRDGGVGVLEVGLGELRDRGVGSLRLVGWKWGWRSSS